MNRYPTTAVPVRRRRRTLLGGGLAIALLAGGSLAGRYYWVRSHTPLVAQAGDPRSLPPQRIAVLYFSDDSRNGTLKHVANGLTESLIGRLGQVDGLDVVSAQGVAPYQDSKITTDSVARVLNAGTLVRGSVEEDGDQLRVSAQLIDGSGASFERQSFHVPLTAVLTAQDSLAGAVADLLRRRLGEEVRLREQRSATTNADAWVLVQRVQTMRRRADSLVKAGDVPAATVSLRQADSLAAVAAPLDVHWAQPLIERGWIALRIARLIREPHLSAGHFDTAMMHATRAIAVDARDADAFEVRGTAGYERVRAGVLVDQRDIDAATNAAEADLRQAIALAPRQATAWNELSLVEQGKMNVIEANNAARRAYEADAYLYAAPDIVYRLWSTSYDLEQFADAIHWCDVGHQRFAGDPRFFRCRLFLMWTPAVAADPNEAWRLVHEITRRTPAQDVEFDRRFVEIAAAVVIGRAGLRDSAHHVLERARVGTDVDPQGELIGFEGVARARLGENDEAIRLTERFLTNHPDHRDFTKLNAWWWRELLKDPRFKKLAGAGS